MGSNLDFLVVQPLGSQHQPLKISVDKKPARGVAESIEGVALREAFPTPGVEHVVRRRYQCWELVGNGQ